ncbi:CUB and zona pellucida-like domain-containing protein 1 isoform X1 [Mytilus californianus]|uniref:CUB and zona pellucida-like domain-containing protein 1 isoform X1 n=1 Tax=Mytilus californianus TaxID=6549 RepID=UPI0022455D6A|nr:CUB and zona pellucida-like domain-containing protein 1 isoform X1 [Mytilus californianus]
MFHSYGSGCIIYYFITIALVNTATTSVGLTANGKRSVITSPNYPQPYGDSYSLEWNILADSSIQNAIVHIEVLDSELSNIFNCYEDIIEIIDGPSSLYSVIRSFCGDSSPSGIVKTSGDSATVTFHASKKDNDYKGFKLEYWAQSKDMTPFRPVNMTSLHWTLLVISMVIFTSFIGGCIFLVVVEMDYRERNEKEKGKWVTIYDNPPDYVLPTVGGEIPIKTENETSTKKKTIKEHLEKTKPKAQPDLKSDDKKLPPLKIIRPTMNIKQWKTLLTREESNT